MPLYPFPDVPDLPGVPALPRSPLFPPATSAGLGLVEGLIWRILQVQTQWGIFDSAGNVLGDPSVFTGLVGDALQSVGIGPTLSTNSLGYDKEMRVSDFPVERGGFAAYNKVELPATPVVTMALDATEADRTFYLNAVDAATKSTNLYNVVTPEVTYINYTIESYRYERRQTRGATLLMLELHLVEIREVSAVFSQTIKDPKNPGATPQDNAGIVQPQVPQTSVLQSVATKLPGLASEATTAIQGLVQ